MRIGVSFFLLFLFKPTFVRKFLHPRFIVDRILPARQFAEEKQPRQHVTAGFHKEVVCDSVEATANVVIIAAKALR